jgi:serine protease
MSQSTSHRLHSLAVATALVLGATAAMPAFAGQVNTAGLQSQATHDRFIVKYRKGGTQETVQQSLTRAANAAGAGKALGLSRVRQIATGAELVRSSRRLDRAEAAALMHQIAADPSVEYVEVDRLLKPVLTPNDPRYGEQWGYFDADAGIRANTAWDVATGANTIVAVLDTGITSHSDLNGNVLAGYDFISDTFVANDGNGRDSNAADPGDWNTDTSKCPAGNSSWHGTHVAGTVAASTNNGVGVAGTAFNARIVPVRVLGRCGGYTSDIADGIIWASGGSVSGVANIAARADVINMSLGGSGACDSTTQAAINGAVSRGTTVVVAAGNSNADAANFSPASCNGVINVASITSSSSRSSFSNYGASIDVSAPGSSILSTLNSGTQGPSTESYASYNGTSMAAPHVAGVVALMQSRRKALGQALLSPSQVESTLKTTAYPLAGTCSGGCGAGIVDARAAVDSAGGSTTPPPSGSLTKGVAVTNLSASAGSYLKFTMSVPSGATNLTFTMSGGTGDADMYVRFGSEPTDTTYTCRPYLAGNNETCTIAAPSAGTYYVNLKAYSSFSGVSLVGDYSTSSGDASQTYTNGTDYAINDNATVDSPISIANRTGYGASSTAVDVDIRHTFRGDLQIDLVAPDGSLYRLKNTSSSDSTDNVITTYNVNLTGELKNGTWKLRVKDIYSGDTGYINSWSITM